MFRQSVSYVIFGRHTSPVQSPPTFGNVEPVHHLKPRSTLIQYPPIKALNFVPKGYSLTGLSALTQTSHNSTLPKVGASFFKLSLSFI